MSHMLFLSGDMMPHQTRFGVIFVSFVLFIVLSFCFGTTENMQGHHWSSLRVVFIFVSPWHIHWPKEVSCHVPSLLPFWRHSLFDGRPVCMKYLCWHDGVEIKISTHGFLPYSCSWEKTGAHQGILNYLHYGHLCCLKGLIINAYHLQQRFLDGIRRTRGNIKKGRSFDQCLTVQ